jgi:glutamate carboxypeptidase
MLGGLVPAAGVNALIEAAHQVQHIAALDRPDLGTTVTPTGASAGSASNVVPATATIVVDVRVSTDAERHRIESAFAALAPRLDGTRITVTGGIRRPPMPESASAELFAAARRLLPHLDGASVGGGSDGNFTAALGVPTLDGLGAVGGGAHADHEYLEIGKMAERAGLVAGLVTALRNDWRAAGPTALR